MARQRRPRDQGRRWWGQAVLTLVLLLAQAASPAVPVLAGPAEDGAPLLLGGGSICHTGLATPPGSGRDMPHPPDGHRHDCALCPACQLAAAPALLPAAWVFAPLQAGPVRVALRPPSTGPPQPERYAAPPRGPPASAV